jgi:predicted RNA-binding protein with PUA-like domain
MAKWLLKSEPSCYSWPDLMRDGKAMWDGVANATALIHLRRMQKGDLALIYHTGGERAAVGIAAISHDPYPDPKEDDPRLVVVDVKPIRKLARPVSLDEIKADPIFAGWDLLRISRLSVVPVPPAMWKRIEQLASKSATPPNRGKK